MGKLHQLEFMLGRLGVTLVYFPSEWQWCVEPCGDLPTISWWIKAGPISLMWLEPERGIDGSWLDREM